MSTPATPTSCDILVFGGTGDLALHKLLPALYRLHREDRLPADTRIFALARSALDNAAFLALAERNVRAVVARSEFAAEQWKGFAARLDYLAMDASQSADFGRLARHLKSSEGRVLVCETIGNLQPMLGDVSNAELAAAMGADVILLNIFDVDNPVINGLPPVDKGNLIRKVKELTGRPVGINLEPKEQGVESSVEADSMWGITGGRLGTLENARKAVDMGVDFIVLTGNPGVGVTNRAIEETLAVYRKEFGDSIVLVAGKMHAAGILSEAGEKIITREDVKLFREAGADVILMPAPGTVPGITMEYIRGLVSFAHELGVLTLTALGTSQEGSDPATIREIALMCKMTGTDMHHLGDAGYGGMALPENILEYGKVIRGVRHTYHRMAASIRR